MTYYVTAVRYSNNGSHISHVLIHNPGIESGRLLKGRVLSKEDVIKLIRNKDIVKTATFDYKSGSWHKGANINTVHNGVNSYLRTDADSTLRDNLGHLMLIDELR
jgi:hypothetical protein